MWCDLRVSGTGSRLRGLFAAVGGVPLIDGGTIRLPRLIGLSRALDLILTGPAGGSQEALQMGLANRVVKTGMAAGGPNLWPRNWPVFRNDAFERDRRSAYEQDDLSWEEALKNEFRLGLETICKRGDPGRGRNVSAKGREDRGRLRRTRQSPSTGRRRLRPRQIHPSGSGEDGGIILLVPGEILFIFSFSYTSWVPAPRHGVVRK